MRHTTPVYRMMLAVPAHLYVRLARICAPRGLTATVLTAIEEYLDRVAPEPYEDGASPRTSRIMSPASPRQGAEKEEV